MITTFVSKLACNSHKHCNQMLTFYNLQHRPILPPLTSTNFHKLAGTSIAAVHRRIPGRRFSSLSIQASKNASEPYISSVGSPPSNGGAVVVQLNLTQRHLTILNVMACAVTISATWLFLSAIPTLLAFKRAAESMAKLMDVTREEIPDTMAAVRLSGMEISDLTMELSDIGQGITQGVKSSTRTVRMAEEKLRGLIKRSPPVSMQGAEPINNKTSVPVVAKTARRIRESIVKGRSIFQMLITVSRLSGVALNYLRSRKKARV